MERGVKVNAMAENAGPDEGFLPSASELSGAVDYGPCLYLGPMGQRCSRRALEGGFCSQHQPGAGGIAAGTPSKWGTRRIVAILTALVALLPFLTDLIRELIRLLK